MLSINWGQAGNVVFSGLIIVFFALVLLIMLVYLASWIINRQNKPNNIPQPVSSVPAAPIPPVPAVRTAPSASSHGETVAVISAAVASYMADSEPGVAYAVTSVTPVGAVRSGLRNAQAGRSKELRPVWGFAGMRQNTEPF